MIGLKVQKSAGFLIGKADRFDLKSPAPVLERSDSKELRDRILGLSASDAQRRGIGKSSLYYLRSRARDRKSFKIHKPVLEKLKLY